MADNFHLSARNLFQLPLASVPAAVWVLTGVLAAVILFGLWKCLKFPLAFHKKEIRWLALLAILLLPCSYFAQFTPFQGSFTGYDGTQFPGVIFFLGLIPAFAALGFAGPLPALVLAAASALAQWLLFGQDFSVILHYGVLTVLFSTLTRRTDLSGSGQSTQKPLINALLAFGLSLPILLVIRLIVLLSFG